MKKFFIKSSILASLVLFSIFGVIYLLPVSKDKYLGASIEKHKLLAETAQPRIIFSGDSNLAFGLDSSKVKESTGYNIINMGLHGGLGLIYYIDEIEPYLKKGDIVIFVLDYQNYYWDGSGSNPLIEITIFNPKVLSFYSFKNYVNYVRNIPITFQRRLKGFFSKSKDDPFNSRSNFNEFGDNIGHLGQPSPPFKTAPRTLPKKLSDDIVILINDFCNKWSREGVDIYLSFSPLLEEDSVKQSKELAILLEDITSRLKLKVIGKPTDFIYPRKYFFDNIFHLDQAGRQIRTKKLITRMKEYKKLSSASHQK